jgi:hypothetical protein
MASNVTTAAETNLIKAAALKRAREIDFVKKFSDFNVAKLMEALGTTRKIVKNEGEEMYVYEITGTLQSGEVPEGEVIPLSEFAQTKTPVGAITLNKWRKATSAEAIMKSGYNTAVAETDAKAIKEVQKGIRSRFFTFLGSINNTTSVTGTGLQAVLAKAWAQLQVLFENDSIEAVHFINPLDIGDYLATASITVQNAFGMKYIEDFLGLGRVILTSQVTQGTIYSTAQDNLILYYLNMGGDVARAFALTTDETGLVGINSGEANNTRAQVESLIMSGLDLMVEYAAGVVVGTINP